MKFYDMNRPEPVCPNADCGADQRDRPRTTAGSPAQPAAPKRAAARPMAPLLDEETEEMESPEEGELHLPSATRKINQPEEPIFDELTPNTDSEE